MTTTVHNFAPNDWESRKERLVNVNVTWPDDKGEYWQSEKIATMAPYQSFRVDRESMPNGYRSDQLALISLSHEDSPRRHMELPLIEVGTQYPQWRATIEIGKGGNSTSYQGEISPFPEKASLLTFPTMLQRGDEVVDYLLLINCTRSPERRRCELTIATAKCPEEIIEKNEVFTNCANLINMKKTSSIEELLVMRAEDMSGIPLFLSVGRKNELSLEHTHPPGSYIVCGDRRAFQSRLKRLWGMGRAVK